MWGVIDIVSAGSCEMEKRYGVVYVDANNLGQGTYKRSKKDSFKWYHDFIENKHKQFNQGTLMSLFFDMIDIWRISYDLYWTLSITTRRYTYCGR